MEISDIMQQVLLWLWSLIMGAAPLIEWLFSPIEILGYNIAPMWLIGGGAGAFILIAGIVRAII